MTEEPHGRLPWLRPGDLDDEQREYYDRLLNSPRDRASYVDDQGRLHGAFNARLLDPPVGTAIQRLGAALRRQAHRPTTRDRHPHRRPVAPLGLRVARPRQGRPRGRPDRRSVGCVTHRRRRARSEFARAPRPRGGANVVAHQRPVRRGIPGGAGGTGSARVVRRHHAGRALLPHGADTTGLAGPLATWRGARFRGAVTASTIQEIPGSTAIHIRDQPSNS